MYNLPREKIAKLLLLALRRYIKVRIFFGKKLVACDFKSKVAVFEPVLWNRSKKSQKDELNDSKGKLIDVNAVLEESCSLIDNKVIEVHFDFIFGCDGANSSVRQLMMR